MNTERFRILVVDDSEMNHLSADRTLQGHNLVHARTLKEALHLMETDAAQWADDEDPDTSEVLMQNFVPPQYDAVLLDLFMPPGEHSSDSEKEAGLIACGLPLAMKAARMSGVKYILVATSCNHHDGALVRLLIDEVGSAPFQINQARVVFQQADCSVEFPGMTCPACKGTGAGRPGMVCRTCWGSKTTPQGKEWGDMLAELMSYDITSS